MAFPEGWTKVLWPDRSVVSHRSRARMVSNAWNLSVAVILVFLVSTAEAMNVQLAPVVSSSMDWELASPFGTQVSAGGGTYLDRIFLIVRSTQLDFGPTEKKTVEDGLTPKNT